MSRYSPLSLRVYRFIAEAARPLTSLLLLYRRKRGKEHPTRVREKQGLGLAARPAGPLIWVHGASVGELLSVLPLVERLRAKDFNILVTSGTVTSAALAKKRLPPGVIHQFAPLDVPRFVSRFLDNWRPDLALFVESDLWPNLIVASAKARTPLIIVNGRLSERSFNRWRVLQGAASTLLRRFDLCLAQSSLDGDRFAQLGASQVHVIGNLKLDVPAPPVNNENLNALKAAIGRRVVIAAASTHPGEELAMIEVHRRLRANIPGLLTIIAPRHPHRGRSVFDAAERAGLAPALRSQRQFPNQHTEIYVADTMGELGLLYSVAPIVFIGGSLVEHGGQNPIEAVKLGAAVIHGPNIWNFAEIYAALDAAHGAEEITDIRRLTAQIAAWLRDDTVRRNVAEAGLKTVNRLGGALDRTLAEIEPYLLQLRLERRSENA